MNALAWWTQVFVRSFSHYIFLPSILLLIVFLLFAPVFHFGTYVGLPDAVNQEDPIKRVFVGVVLGVLWLTVLYCGYLLWLKDCRDGHVLPPADWDELTKEGRGNNGESAEAQPSPPAHIVPFGTYATMISLYFVVTLLALIGLVIVARGTVGYFTNVLGFHIVGVGINLEPDIPKFKVDPKAEIVCEEPLFTSLWIALPFLWGSFLATAVFLPIIGKTLQSRFQKYLSDYRYGHAGASPSALIDRRWEVAWVALTLVLTGLACREHESMSVPFLRPIMVAFAFVVGGAIQWTIYLTKPKERDDTFWKGLFGAWWVLHVIVAYSVITFFFSQDWVLGWTMSLVFLMLTRLLWHFGSAPIHWAWTALGAPVIKPHDAGESEARETGARLALLGIGFFIFICALGTTQSPATFVSFFFFGLAIAYAGLSLHLHRAKLVILAFFLFAFVFSGVQAYHYRFPGLLQFYNDDIAKGLRHLEYCEAEHLKQVELDELILKYHTLIKKNGIDKANERMVRTQDESEMKALMNDPLVKHETKNLLEKWAEFENGKNGNRILPVRQPDPDVIEVLKFGKGATMPVSSPPLLPLEDFDFEPHPPVVVVAISGGGIRSAAWAFVVLKELELHFTKAKINFPQRVRIVTGASGGMLGASYYVDLLNEPATPFVAPNEDNNGEAADWTKLAEKRKELLARGYCNHLTKDTLTPIMQQMVLGDIPSMFSPWPSKYDRGRALEEAWEANMGIGKTFAQIRDDEIKRKRPFLVFTPMMIEDGRRLLISNLDLRNIVQNTGNLLVANRPPHPNGEIYSREAVEMFRLFPDAHETFKVSTAVRMSASFPFFSPAVPLPTVPRRRVVDAGYYDNYGISLAAAWLFSQRNARVFAKTSKRFLIVQIRDTLSDEKRAMTKVTGRATAGTGRFAEEILSPAEGLVNSWDGSSSFRNDGQLELLSQYMTERGGAESKSFNVVTFELELPAPLSWQLTATERNHLWQAIQQGDHKARMDKMVEWWKSPERQNQ